MLDLLIERKLTGLYNLGSRDSISKFNFALQIRNAMSEYVKTSTNIRSVQAANSWPRNDFKSQNMSMDCSALECALGIKLPEVCYDLRDYTIRTLREYLRHS